MDKEQIKKALDHFENDEFSLAKDILTKEIQKKRDEHLKDKLELKSDLSGEPDEDAKGEDPEADAEDEDE